MERMEDEKIELGCAVSTGGRERETERSRFSACLLHMLDSVFLLFADSLRLVSSKCVRVSLCFFGTFFLLQRLPLDQRRVHLVLLSFPQTGTVAAALVCVCE